MHIVIIAGGTGSRLWPVSREAHPKPFIRMEDGFSLLQKTYLRGQAAGVVESVTTATNHELFFRTADDYQELAPRQPMHYLLEPFGRNTAPAVAAAALELQEGYGNDALMLVLPADHLIQDEAAFAQAVTTASEAAAKGMLVTFGIQPTHAETGFGYLELADDMHTSGQVQRVARFVEKPSYEGAAQYLIDGRHLWNSGMFCFRVGTVLDELSQHAPALLLGVSETLANAGRSEREGHTIVHLCAERFGEVEDDSIDFALMEKSEKVAVVPCDLGWSDIGSWQAMAALTEPDTNGNRIIGDVELEGCHNTYVHSPHRMAATIGIDDLIIVDTADAFLVAHKDRSQEVKKIVSRIKERGGDLHQVHVTVHRPWGMYTVLEKGERFKMKRIEVKPGATLSLQMHYHRNEHWVVVSGTALVVNGEREFLLQTNESTYIPAGHKHRLSNPGIVPLIMIEVQSGEYLGEDDIVRFEDSYGRCG